MKRKIVIWLIKLINWIDQPLVNNCNIGDKFEIDVKTLVPPDNKWHHCAFTVDYWLKFTGEGIVKEQFFLDGVCIKKDLREIIKLPLNEADRHV